MQTETKYNKKKTKPAKTSSFELIYIVDKFLAVQNRIRYQSTEME